MGRKGGIKRDHLTQLTYLIRTPFRSRTRPARLGPTPLIGHKAIPRTVASARTNGIFPVYVNKVHFFIICNVIIIVSSGKA